MRRKTINTRLAGVYLAIAALVTFSGGGCASTAEVTGESSIATAQYAIRDAENAGAERHAPDKLASAKEKVQAAKVALNDGMPSAAARNANEATVDAQFSAAVTRRESSRQQLSEAQATMDEAERLRKETTRAAEERAK